MLRAGARRSPAALQPTLLRAGLILSPLSVAMTTTPSSKQTQIRSLSSNRPSPASLVIQYRAEPPRRNTSTRHQTTHLAATPDAEADANAAAAAAKAAASAHPEQVVLDWNTFFQLRKARRRWQTAFSVVGALASGSSGALVLSSGMADSVVGQIPLDPLITLGLMTMSFAALGWLVGPSLGSAVFNALKSKYKGPMAVKESEFFARIKKHRVDPSASSVRNPVPDFYGEKISSVTGYRQWLRDQRAFNKKKEGSLV
ncbi:Pam17-domain-containing protein [Parathielavia appendiculata]|uniref:Presequence translocated-associated motor subunit PAM17 n=1 Tax=Parathielavia appendiculata TaxID=2587402 RepID=A0AAN6U9S6_9PEZI|nr:Pam17-domain-containing protein [Parathielavia appendiculata]